MQAKGLFVLGGERSVEYPEGVAKEDDDEDETRVLSEVAALDLRGGDGGSDIWFHLPLAGALWLAVLRDASARVLSEAAALDLHGSDGSSNI